MRRRGGAAGIPPPGPGAAPGTVVLRGADITVERRGRRLLDGVDVEVRAGELVAVVGPNGAGKSTLLAALAGDLRPSGGRILLHGHPVAELAPLDVARRRAVLPQQVAVGFPFLVREVVAMGRAPWARTPARTQDDELVADALVRCDVAHLADRPVTTLSGGERARVGLARVLAQGTGLLLLDEPTAALDLRHQELVLQVAHDGCRAGRSVVAVLHDLGLAGAYAHRVVLLHEGRVAGSGPPATVLTAERIEAVYGCPVDLVTGPAGGAPAVVPRRPPVASAC